MNIYEVRNNYLNSGREKEFSMLIDLYEKTRNCSLNGYLGSGNINFSVDEQGVLEYFTKHTTFDSTFESNGAVLDDSVLIRQTQSRENRVYCQLISWNVPDNTYTYIAFDDVASLDDSYCKLKNSRVNLAHVDIDSEFRKLGISFDGVAQVLLNKKADILAMLGEDRDYPENKSSFML